MHVLEFNVRGVVPASQILWIWWFCAELFWIEIPHVRTARVEWTISNSWKDESCTNICSQADMRCTERCWPAGPAGLQEMLRITQPLNDVCFAVREGTPAAWHPAKDDDSTLCYSNAGAVSGRRCPIVSVTAIASQMKSKMIRRFCPCYNATSIAVNGVLDERLIDDCGLGSQLAATTRAPAASAPSPGAAGSAPSAKLPGASYGSSSSCTRVCVEGFSGLDADLNGPYSLEARRNVFSHWSRMVGSSNIRIDKSNGKWRFAQATRGGSMLTLAEARNSAYAGSQVPASDTYTSGRQEYGIAFMCCGTASEDVAQASVESKGLDTTVIIVGGGFVAVVVILCTLSWLRCSNASKKRAAAAHAAAMSHAAAVDFEAGAAMSMHPPSSPPKAREGRGPPDWAERQSMRHDSEQQASNYGNGPSTWSGSDQPWHSKQNGHSQGGHHDFASQSVRSSASPQHNVKAVNPHDPFSPPPMRSKYGGGGSDVMGSTMPDNFGSRLPNVAMPNQMGGTQYGGLRGAGRGNDRDNRAAMEIASVLGESHGASHGAPISHGRGQSAYFEEGLKVRIVGLNSEPTWDGAEGVVDLFDEYQGMVRILFEDGRTKAIPQENCELSGRTPARIQAQAQAHGRLAPGSQPHELAQRGGHSGNIAKPQGTVPNNQFVDRKFKMGDMNFPAAH